MSVNASYGVRLRVCGPQGALGHDIRGHGASLVDHNDSRLGREVHHVIFDQRRDGQVEKVVCRVKKAAASGPGLLILFFSPLLRRGAATGYTETGFSN